MLFKKFLCTSSCKMTRLSSSIVHPSSPSISPKLKEKKIKIKNFEINYLKVGHGPHQVFCVPGMMGTIWSNFKKQIEGFDLNKFSLLIWDAPGYGKSIALDNNETLDECSRDANIAYEFMKALQIPKYSVLGWSYGGCTSLLLASRHPQMVEKVVVWACSTFIKPHELKYYYTLRDLNTWSPRTKEAMIKLYGEDNFRKKIEHIIAVREAISKGYCSSVKKIKCPTLILHGGKDPIVDSSHLNYMQNLIKNSRTYLYPDGEHHIHSQFADDFNKRVQEFLLEPNT
ncbi:valacyclovir hydrolase-like [Nymphalis io]|uniref:valacyclovir hydrolase-like n=1 Tax=Inachis io TaxID=171585 RepID=UPI002167B386|nr:valacyclovir hydrolase-like [Nymphalis io]